MQDLNFTYLSSFPECNEGDELFMTEAFSSYLMKVYLTMAVLGIVGNIITCLVITVNKSMHTVINYYLFNLAISDLMILFWGFPPLNVYLKYTDFTCKLRTTLAESCTYVSVLTISILSVERYIAICHPFLTRTLSNLARSKVIIPLIWLVAILSALPISLQMGLLCQQEFNRATCSDIHKTLPYIYELSSFIFFILPMMTMIVLYILIGFKLKSRSSIRTNQNRNIGKHGRVIDKSGRRTIKLLASVAAAFFICWAPFHVQRVFSSHFDEWFNNDQLDDILFIYTQVTGVIYYASAIINPILYNTLSNKFRHAFKNTFTRNSNNNQL